MFFLWSPETQLLCCVCLPRLLKTVGWPTVLPTEEGTGLLVESDWALNLPLSPPCCPLNWLLAACPASCPGAPPRPVTVLATPPAAAPPPAPPPN